MAKPDLILKIRTLDTLDKLILALTEFRDTAIRSGGFRSYFLRGDAADSPCVELDVNLTPQAFVCKDGNPPKIGRGRYLDAAVEGARSEALAPAPRELQPELEPPVAKPRAKVVVRVAPKPASPVVVRKPTSGSKLLEL